LLIDLIIKHLKIQLIVW